MLLAGYFFYEVEVSNSENVGIGALFLFVIYVLNYFPYIPAIAFILLVAGGGLFLGGFLSGLPKAVRITMQVLGVFLALVVVAPIAFFVINHYGLKYGFISYSDGSHAKRP